MRTPRLHRRRRGTRPGPQYAAPSVSAAVPADDGGSGHQTARALATVPARRILLLWPSETRECAPRGEHSSHDVLGRRRLLLTRVASWDFWTTTPGSSRPYPAAPGQVGAGRGCARVPSGARGECLPRTVVARQTSRRQSRRVSRCRWRWLPNRPWPVPATCSGRCPSPDRCRSAMRPRWRVRCRNPSP